MSLPITFCVLAYKESPYLDECLQNLIKQGGKIILCTSTPNNYLRKMAAKYKIALKINKESKGIAADWNFAFKQARSKYVTLAHQDDIYLPGYAETVVGLLEQYSDSTIAFTDYLEQIETLKGGSFKRDKSLNFFIKHSIIRLSFKGGSRLRTKQEKVSLLRFGSPIPCPGVCYNKKNIKANFKFNDQLKINMDWFAWNQLARQKGSFVFSNKKLLIHRIHQASATSQGLAANLRQQEDQQMFKLFWPKKISKLLSRLYSISYWSNNV